MADIKLSEFSQKTLDELKSMSGINVPAFKDDIDNYKFDINELAGISDVNSETERAVEAETALSGKIDEESDRAKAAEQELSTNIDEESDRAKEAETVLSGSIDAEAERAKLAEESLSGKIDEETARAGAAEAELESLIDTETERAKEAEAAAKTEVKSSDNTIRVTSAVGTNGQTIYDIKATDIELSAGNNISITKNGKINTIAVTGMYSNDEIDTAIEAEATRAVEAEDALQTALNNEIARATSAEKDEEDLRFANDNFLQSEIDAINAKSDVVDIVGSYAELEDYDTSYLTDKDVVKVLKDETSADATTYYRWMLNTSAWSGIGSVGPYYTVSEVDQMFEEQTTIFDGKIETLQIEIDNETSAREDADTELLNTIETVSGDLNTKIDNSVTEIYETIETVSGDLNTKIDNSVTEIYETIETVSGEIIEVVETTSATLDDRIDDIIANTVEIVSVIPDSPLSAIPNVEAVSGYVDETLENTIDITGKMAGAPGSAIPNVSAITGYASAYVTSSYFTSTTPENSYTFNWDGTTLTYEEVSGVDTDAVEVGYFSVNAHNGVSAKMNIDKQELEIGLDVDPSTLGDSWKNWSEEHGSTAEDNNNSIYLGTNNVSEVENEDLATFNIGNDNNIVGDVPDSRKQWSEQDLIAVNIGRTNNITGEGFNLGKSNSSTEFGLTLGQYNSANNAALSIGQYNSADRTSVAIGQNSNANYASMALGLNSSAKYGGYTLGTKTSAENASIAIGEMAIADHGSIAIRHSSQDANCLADGGSVLFGINSISAITGSIALGGNGTIATTGSIALGFYGVSANEGSVAIGKESVYSNVGGIVYGARGITGINGGIAIGAQGVSSKNSGIAIGVNSVSANEESLVFGREGSVAFDGSMALGKTVSGQYGSTVMGKYASANYGSLVVGQSVTGGSGSIIFGKTIPSGYFGSILVGEYIRSNGTNIAFGRSITANGGSTLNVGFNLLTDGGSYALGARLTAAYGGNMSLGTEAMTYGGGSFALVTNPDKSFNNGNSYTISGFIDGDGKFAPITFASAHYQYGVSAAYYPDSTKAFADKTYLDLNNVTLLYKPGNIEYSAKYYDLVSKGVQVGNYNNSNYILNNYSWWKYPNGSNTDSSGIKGVNLNASTISAIDTNGNVYTNIVFGCYGDDKIYYSDNPITAYTIKVYSINDKAYNYTKELFYQLKTEGKIPNNIYESSTIYSAIEPNNIIRRSFTGYNSLFTPSRGTVATNGSYAIGKNAEAYNGSMAISIVQNPSYSYALRDSKKTTEYTSEKTSLITPIVLEATYTDYKPTIASAGGFAIGTYTGSEAYNGGISIGSRVLTSAFGVGIGERTTAFSGSYALGVDIYATNGATVLGKQSTATNGGIELGNYNGTDNSNILIGHYNQMWGGGTLGKIFGVSNTANGNNSIDLAIIGSNNNINGNQGTVYTLGVGNTIQGNSTSRITVIGNCSTTSGCDSASLFMIGDTNYVTQQYGKLKSALIYGTSNTACSGGTIIEIGNNNLASDAAITIGNENAIHWGGYGIALGWKNSSYMNGPFGNNYAHTIMLGANNTNFCYSATISASDNTLLETFNNLVGCGNIAYGYNLFAFGAHNIVGTTARAMWEPKYGYHKNMGFAFALGYANTAVRNFDMAIGYKSIASGGENIAITNSTAFGTRNFIYNHSMCYAGDENIAINNSTVVGNNNIVVDHSNIVGINAFDNNANSNITHNILKNTSLLAPTAALGKICNNTFIESTISATNVPTEISRNNINASVIMAVSSCRTDYGPTLYENIIDRSNIHNGSQIAFNNIYGSYIENLSGQGLYKNTFINSIVVQEDIYNSINNNYIIGGMLRNSQSNFSFADGPLLNPEYYNRADNQGIVGVPKDDSFVNGRDNWYSHGPISAFTQNTRTRLTGILRGAAESVINGFYLYETHYGLDYVTDAIIDNSKLCFNIGNNTIMDSMESMIFGSMNNIINSQDDIILGVNNAISGGEEVSRNRYDWPTRHNLLVGANNIIMQASSTNDAMYNTLNGYENIIIDNYDPHHNIINGAGNIISGNNTVEHVHINGRHNIISGSNYFINGFIFGESNIAAAPGNDTRAVIASTTESSLSINDYIDVCINPDITTCDTYPYIIYKNSTGNIDRLQVTATNVNDLQTYRVYNIYTNGTDNVAFSVNDVPTSEEYTLCYKNMELRYSSGNKVFLPYAKYENVVLLSKVDNTYTIKVQFYNYHGNYTIGTNNYNKQIKTLLVGDANSAISDSSNMGLSNVFGSNNLITNGKNFVVGENNIGNGILGNIQGEGLIGNTSQTVVGRFNTEMPGTYGKTTDSNDKALTNWEQAISSGALFVVGNGYYSAYNYSTKSYKDVVRSNAMVVSADGTVSAKRFVSEGGEIDMSVLAELVTLLKSKPTTGVYTIMSNNGTLEWSEINTVTE